MCTVFPHQRVLSKRDGLRVYQCVAMGHYIDAVSLEFRNDNDMWTCHVGLYQITCNTKNHVDSYAQMQKGKELGQFKTALKRVYGTMPVDIRFFWMVGKLQEDCPKVKGAKLLQVKGATLHLTPTTTELQCTAWNFIKDKSKVYTASRKDQVGGMPEYVVVYNPSYTSQAAAAKASCHLYETVASHPPT